MGQASILPIRGAGACESYFVLVLVLVLSEAVLVIDEKTILQAKRMGLIGGSEARIDYEHERCCAEHERGMIPTRFMRQVESLPHVMPNPGAWV